MKRLIGLLGILAGMAGCGGPTALTPAVSGPGLRGFTLGIPDSTRPDSAVDQKRLEETLAVLSGKTPAVGGQIIKDRGGKAGRDLTREYLSMALADMGYTVERQAFGRDGANLMARLPATEKTSRTILVGAHMDSVGNAGADDNGSGSTATLEAARVLAAMPGRKVDVLFCWFDLEELGLVGSYHMARDFKKRGIKLESVHTSDMIGWDADGDKMIEIEQPDANLWDYYKASALRHDIKTPMVRTSSGATDHVAFRDEGFTSVGLCEEWWGHDTTPYYHRKTDTFETINFAYLADVTRLLVAAVGDLTTGVAAPPKRPTLPHHMFPGRDHDQHGTHDRHQY